MSEGKDVSICCGWVAKNQEGSFLNEKLLWVKVERDNAYVHLSNMEDFPRFEKKVMDEVVCLYPTMVVNGQPLFGGEFLKDGSGRFLSS